MLPIVIAIDPGRSKCGLAAVERGGIVRYRAIVPTEALPAAVSELAARLTPEAILIGDGTGAAALHDQLALLALTPPLVSVDERHTSEQARARCLAEHRPRGWRRLIPRSLRVPDAPYDDCVAIILAERWWNAHDD